MDTKNLTNKKLVAEKTKQLITVKDKYPDLPSGGLVIKVRKLIIRMIYTIIYCFSVTLNVSGKK